MRKVVCQYCKSEAIVADASVTWNPDLDDWEIAEVWEKGAYCDGCEHHDARYEFVEIADAADDVDQGADNQGRAGDVDTHDQLGSIRDRSHNIRRSTVST